MFIPKNETITKNLEDMKVSALFFGEPMVGKTRLASTFPFPLFLNTDGNIQDINREVIDLRETQEVTFNGKTGKASKWTLFKVYVERFNEEEFTNSLKEAGYETIVLDVLDHLYDWCREYILTGRGIKDESEDSRAYSPIYSEIKKEFKDVMIRLIEGVKSTFNLVLVSFEDTEEYNEGLDKKLKRVPSLKKKMENSSGIDKAKTFEAITSRVSMVGGIFMFNQTTEDGVKEVRALVANPSKDFFGGNRFNINKPILPDYESIKKEIKGE